MRLYFKIEKLTDYILQLFLKVLIYIHELKNIHKKKPLYSKVNLTENQEKEIDELWLENYGKKYSKKWSRLYQSYTGKYDVNYFPEILFSTKLEPLLNPRYICRTLTDKAITEMLINDAIVKMPKTIVVNANGYYYDNNRIIINKEQTMKILHNIGEAVIKPTINSSSGRGVRAININDSIDYNSGKEIDTIIESYGENFIVQEKINAHSSYSKLHAESINTLRVITYISNGEIYCAPLSLRIGMNGSFVDNAHAGGIVVGLSDDGQLKDKAFSEMQDEYTTHPDSGIVFEDHIVVKTREIIDAAKRLHGHLPNLGIVSWDFTVDENSEIILIEINLNSQTIWFPQYANGCGIFGEHTGSMIRLISSKSGML